MKIRSNIKLTVTLLLVAITGAALSGCGKSGTYATQKNFITIGCVSPLTGELASFGEGTPETEEAAVAAINENEGLYIDTLQRKLKIRFLVADSRSTAEGAEEAAKQLITEEHVDVVICSSGNLTAKAAAGVCEREQVPFFSVNAEADAWLAGGPYEYSFNCSYDNTSRLQALADVWAEMGMTSVGLLAVQSEEAEQFAGTLDAFCKENGISCTNPGFIDPESLDYSRAVSALAAEKVQAVICFMECDEFSDVWGQKDLKELDPGMCVLVNNHLSDREMADMKNGADIGEFYTLTCWDKTYPFRSSLTEEDGSALGLWWEDRFLSSSSELLGYKHGCVEIAVDAVKLAMALDAESIASAARSLDVDTLLGQVNFDSESNCRLPSSVLKWSFDPSTVTWTKELVSHSRLTDVEFEED